MKKRVPKSYGEIRGLTDAALVAEFKALVTQRCHDAIGRLIGYDIPEQCESRLRLAETELLLRLKERK